MAGRVSDLTIRLGEHLPALGGVAAFHGHGPLPRRSGIRSGLMSAPRHCRIAGRAPRPAPVIACGRAFRRLSLISIADHDRGVQPARCRGRPTDRWGCWPRQGQVAGARSDSWRNSPADEPSSEGSAQNPKRRLSGRPGRPGAARGGAGGPPFAGCADDPALWRLSRADSL